MMTLSFGETFVSPSPLGGPDAEGIVSGTVLGAGLAGAQLAIKISIMKKMIDEARGFIRERTEKRLNIIIVSPFRKKR